MPLDWSPFVEFVHRHKQFLLTTHVRPDGDGLGSILALGEALEGLGKQVRLVIPSRLPPRYAFLDPQKKIQVFSPPGDGIHDCDAIIVMDTGTWNQLDKVGEWIRKSSAEKIVIDHHHTQDDIGGTALVDVSAEATGRLAFEAINALRAPITPAMANNLFVAVAMDTGWFRHANATRESYYLAGDLIAAGARVTTVYEQLFERDSLPRQLLRARMLNRIELFAGGKGAYSYIVFSDYAETGAKPLDTEDFINDLRSIFGVELVFLQIEQREGNFKVSFRSRNPNVAQLAEQFGGGGHKLASGATLPGPLDRALGVVRAAATELLT